MEILHHHKEEFLPRDVQEMKVNKSNQYAVQSCFFAKDGGGGRGEGRSLKNGMVYNVDLLKPIYIHFHRQRYTSLDAI